MKKAWIYLIVVMMGLIACYLPFYQADKPVAFEIIETKAEELVADQELKEEDKKFIRRQYQLNESDYENIFCYGPISAMEVNEFTIIEAKNETQKQHLISQLTKRVNQQLESFQGYAPRQAALLQKAKVYEKGSYIILIVHENASELEQQINALF